MSLTLACVLRWGELEHMVPQIKRIYMTLSHLEEVLRDFYQLQGFYYHQII